MNTNVIKAFIEILNNPNPIIDKKSQGPNRINNQGDPFELFIKNCFSGVLTNIKKIDTEEKQDLEHKKYFSFLGQKDFSPDLILKNSDAVEIKKMEAISGQVALNSSFPRNKLMADDKRINKARDCEDWQIKDIVYVIGSVKSKKLRRILFVYGDCFAKNNSKYSEIEDDLHKRIAEIPVTDASYDGNELGSVNLGNARLRIRGMYSLDNPINILPNNIKLERGKRYSVVIMKQEKFYTLPSEDRKEVEKYTEFIKIKDPDDNKNLIDAVLIKTEL